MAVVFETPGLIDVRAFTMFGVNSKPNTVSPIGFFGTGLKYSVAVLVREKIPLTLWIGSTQYQFYAKEQEFRDKKIVQIQMRKKSFPSFRWSYYKLPFTTELGKNWKLWQVFRELHSNTIDENGATWLAEPGIHAYQSNTDGTPSEGRSGTTMIVVDSPKFTEEYHKRDEIFLPEGLRQRPMDGAAVQIFKKPSKHLYWRGLRVQDLEKPGIYTYNILQPLELTEDRTLKYDFEGKYSLANFIAKSNDQHLVSTIVSAPTDKFESQLDFEHGAYTAPSSVFTEVVRKKRTRHHYVTPSASAYHSRYDTPSSRDEEDFLDKLIRLTAQKEWTLLIGEIRLNPEGFMEILKGDVTYEPKGDGYPKLILTHRDTGKPVVFGQPELEEIPF